MIIDSSLIGTTCKSCGMYSNGIVCDCAYTEPLIAEAVKDDDKDTVVDVKNFSELYGR